MGNTKKIAIIGSGYVGTTLAAILSNVGYQTVLIDVNKSKIDSINSGKSHFYEVGLDDLIKIGVNNDKLHATDKYNLAISGADVIFICVGTPENPDGSPNMSYTFSAVESMIPYLKQNCVIAQRSTVPIGTGRKIINAITKQRPELEFGYVSNPEFLAEGSALADSLNPSRVVLGSDSSEAIDKIKDIFYEIEKYSKNVDITKLSKYSYTYSKNKPKTQQSTKFILTGLESAEMIKVSSNSFLALKISYANSLAKLADSCGASIDEVMEGVGSDDRIGRSFLYPGLGYGGGCFPKDVAGLISSFEELDIYEPILPAQYKVNESMVDYAIDKIKHLPQIKSISVLGLSFKPGTSDCRQSQSIRLVNKLVNNYPEVRVFDPLAMEEAKESISDEAIFTDGIEECLTKTDLAIIGTEWSEFIEYNWEEAIDLFNQRNIFDARGRLDSKKLKEMGYNYIGIGRS